MVRSLAVCSLAALSCWGLADVSVQKGAFLGWKDCYTISNGTVEVVVVPQIGRVMRYGYIGDTNILWVNPSLQGQTFAINPNTYRNYGGDKLWITPQSLWNWPPDSKTDGQPWTCEVIPNGVRLTSPVSGIGKVSFKRDITVAANGSQVTFVNVMVNQGDRQVLGVWQDTQIDDPEAAFLGIELTSDQRKGWFGFGRESLDKNESIQDGKLIIHRSPNVQRKFGSASQSGVVSAIKRSLTFTSQSKVYRGALYPDQGSAQTISTSANPYPYVQLGQRSPLGPLEPNEAVMQTVVWTLSKA